MIFLHRGDLFLCMHSCFCCFSLHFTLLCLSMLVTYGFIAQQFTEGCWERRWRAMTDKSQNPKVPFQHYWSFLLKWLLDTAPPSSLNQTQSRRTSTASPTHNSSLLPLYSLPLAYTSE